MRSILFAMAITAIATISTGCTMSCKFTGPCKTISQTCSVDQCGPNCTSCTTKKCGGMFGRRMLRNQNSSCGGDCGGECGSTTCNAMQPMQMQPTQMQPTQQTTGCNDGCPDGLMGGCASGDCGAGGGRGLLGGGLFQGRNRMRGMGLFSKSSCGGNCGGASCGDDSCGCGNATPTPMATPAQGAMGCGKFGCGQGGMLCSGCRGLGRGGLAGGHPYGGQVPHTPAPSYGGMGGAAPTPTYSYPYYTTRGPRDFLNGNPPSIGR